MGVGYATWVNAINRPSRASLDKPEFDGLVFDEDPEEKRNPNNDVKVWAWKIHIPAFDLMKLGLRFPDMNGNLNPSMLIPCIQERKLPIESTLEQISHIFIHYKAVRDKDKKTQKG